MMCDTSSDNSYSRLAKGEEAPQSQMLPSISLRKSVSVTAVSHERGNRREGRRQNVVVEVVVMGTLSLPVDLVSAYSGDVKNDVGSTGQGYLAGEE